MHYHCCRPSDKTRFPLFVSFYFSLSSLLQFSSAVVTFRTDTFSVSFLDAPARFGKTPPACIPRVYLDPLLFNVERCFSAAAVDAYGICGALFVAEPIDACSSLQNVKPVKWQEGLDLFVLIVRGSCSFEDKVRNAQKAGFRAAIVYDDQENGSLISMVGNSKGVWANAVFVTKMTGDALKQLAMMGKGQCCISSSTEEAAGTVLVISFISLIVIISVIVTFFFVRYCRPSRHGAHNHPLSMNRQEVEALPCFTYKSAFPNGKRASENCAICLEDYKDGDTLRVLPCEHEFHSVCIDLWLTKWGTFCPICKHQMSSGP